MKLTEKQQKFVDFYLASGNAEEAARKAGYNARGNTTKLLQNTTIQQAIKERQKQLEPSKIASMEEVQNFWAETMRDKNVERKDRLKASEYIARTNAAFIEKREINGNLGVTIVDDIDED